MYDDCQCGNFLQMPFVNCKTALQETAISMEASILHAAVKFFVPDLMQNIIDLGQIDEAGNRDES